MMWLIAAGVALVAVWCAVAAALDDFDSDLHDF